VDRLDLSDWQLYGLRVRQLLGMMRRPGKNCGGPCARQTPPGFYANRQNRSI
jgi:hypothetical protein